MAVVTRNESILGRELRRDGRQVAWRRMNLKGGCSGRNAALFIQRFVLKLAVGHLL